MAEETNLSSALSDDQPGEVVSDTGVSASSGDLDVFDTLYLLWRRRWRLFSVSVLFGALGAAYAFLSTPIFRVDTVLAFSRAESSPSLPGGLSSFASLAGISLGAGSTDHEKSLGILRSRALMEDFIVANNLLPVLFSDRWDDQNAEWRPKLFSEPPDIRDGVRLFNEEVLSIDEDEATGLIMSSVEWKNASLASIWAKEYVEMVNERIRARDLLDARRRLEYLRDQLDEARIVEIRQSLASLIEQELQRIMLAQAESEYAFTVIDPARVPDEPVAPRKFLIVATSMFLGLAISGFVVVLRRVVAARSAGSHLANPEARIL